MTNKINYSQNFDAPAPILEDLIPERLIKVFPYELVNANKADEFAGANAVSIVAISQNNLDTLNEELSTETELVFNTKLKQTEQGNKYFEMFAAITSEGKLDFSSSTSSVGQELKEEESFVALSNWSYEGELSNIQAGKLSFVPAVCTIGKPFDRDEYESGNQPMYIMSSNVEAVEGDAQFADKTTNDEGLYEFSLANVSVLESSFTNSVLRFSEVMGNHLVDAGGKWLPTTTPVTGQPAVPGISIELQTDSLVSKISGKGNIEQLRSDVDFQVTEKLTPMKATPISVQDKVTMFMDWFDYDVVMPEFIAELFITGASIESLKDVDIDKNGVKEPFFRDAEVNLIADMLAYSAAYASSFSQFPRNATGSDAGKIQSDQTIGTKKAKLVAIEGKDSIKVIDGLYEEYIREFPSDDNSIQFRALKQILAALSRYIYSSYAIGKGQNSFNQIYLPWYLSPSDNIDIKSNSNNWTFDSNKKFTIASRWFDIKGGLISPKSDVNISDVKLIQTDRKLTLPEVGDTITAINKLPLPGDINTKSATDLQYFWYLPIEQVDFEKLYLNDVSVTVDNSNQKKKFDTRWTDYGKVIPTDRAAWVKTEAAFNFKLSESKINVVTGTGTVVSSVGSATSSGLATVSKGGGTPHGNQAIYTSAIWATLPDQGGPTNISGPANLTDAQFLGLVSIVTGIPVDALEVVNNNARAIKYRTSGSLVWQGSTYAMKRYRITDAEVIINGRTSTVSFDRGTLFDKVGWHFFVSDYLGVSSSLQEYHLIEERGLDIEKLTEITISQLWGDEAVLHLGIETISIPLLNETDESIGTQRIIFT